ncbi:FGGY-family carbohydrate kinase [Negadavirga shengliensis]|uniref:FGGY-family carbohydrate kinase n=1 Tax=Negadavirga shengliensis TaxID=1389218 RepID=A0ABV9T7I2_9BACT
MPLIPGYIVVDVGTGNVRVAITDRLGKILSFERRSMSYLSDEAFESSFYFNPGELWEKIGNMVKLVLEKAAGQVEIKAITASSQREGIVLMDKDGNSLLGLPNHDHRGRAWEDTVKEKERIYELTGRFPSSLFSAFKLIGTREKYQGLYSKVSQVLSISDWVQFQLSGVMGYEHSQASETLLYDVEKMVWSDELAGIFGINLRMMPPLHHSGEILGTLNAQMASEWDLNDNVPVVVGGADTQLAIKSTRPMPGDIVLVSGTTTPVVKVVDHYRLDKRQRSWTGRHIERGQFILETNAGVTGLNFQRLKEIFYPNEGYEVIENELKAYQGNNCLASLGSLIAGDAPLTTGGFFFKVPVGQDLGRAAFIQAALWDMACSIKENYNVLVEIEDYDRDYVWGCGGGFQSHTLSSYLGELLQKKIRIRENFSQASVTGAALVCNEALGITPTPEDHENVVEIESGTGDGQQYEAWKRWRKNLRQIEI